MTHCPETARLSLLVQRILDAEVLPDADGMRLLQAAEAVSRALEAGDRESACGHVERLARFTEALVGGRAVDPADGHAVLAAARRLLDSPPDLTPASLP